MSAEKEQEKDKKNGRGRLLHKIITKRKKEYL